MRCDAGDFALYADIVARLGEVRPAGRSLKFRCPLPDRHKHGDANPSAWCMVGDRGDLIVGCFGCQARRREIAAALGVPYHQFFHDRHERQRDRQMSNPQSVYLEVARHHYHHTDGSLAATKVKQKNGFGHKYFFWQRPLPAAFRFSGGVPEGVAAWVAGHDCMEAGWFEPRPSRDGTKDVWFASCDHKKQRPSGAVELPACKLYLYRLHEVNDADPKKPVVVVEGEKDVHTLLDLGFVATCPPHGSNRWDAEASAVLFGRRVLVIPDNDDPGMRHAERVVGSLVCRGVKEVRVLWPGHLGYAPPDKGGDVTDWLLSAMPSAGTKERFAALADLMRKCKPYTLAA